VRAAAAMQISSFLSFMFSSLFCFPRRGGRFCLFFPARERGHSFSPVAAMPSMKNFCKKA